MRAQKKSSAIRLFYSYSHKDAEYRDSMEQALASLRREGVLHEWSDHKILPGQQISSTVRKQMDSADIVVFLFSKNFISSKECMNEWDYAVHLQSRNRPLCRIPVIVKPSAWLDILGGDNIKALPKDGMPVSTYSSEDEAWQQVFEGIKEVVEELRTTFSPKEELVRDLEQTEFISESHLSLSEMFVFPRLTIVDELPSDQSDQQHVIANCNQLLDCTNVLVHGYEKTGKTALARYLFLSLVEDQQPVLLLNSSQVGNKPFAALFADTYEDQFFGEYSLWNQQSNKTLILEDMTDTPALLRLIREAGTFFDRIVVTVSSDIYYSYFRDEVRLSEFRHLKIEPLTRSQQEQLIRRRVELSEVGQPISDGYIDEIEREVNAVMVSEKLLPRYPFYVLTILQTYEAYMPSNMAVTSYGHCYYVLIVARLLRAGISKTDDAIDACFNFAEELAFATFQHVEAGQKHQLEFSDFIESYEERYVIRRSTINRLRHPQYGILDHDGRFKSDYMYYYFLGKYLATHELNTKSVISQMCDESFKEANFLTLLFIIHHTKDSRILDDVLLRTMCTLDEVPPAVLDVEETKRFGRVVLQLPQSILSEESVKEARTRERNLQEELEGTNLGMDRVAGILESDSPANFVYRLLRNNRILGQVLRNRHGSLERDRIEEIVQAISDSGLRLVNLVLRDEEEIGRMARFIHGKSPDLDMEEIKEALRFFSFLWTMLNLEQVVDAINIPVISEAVDAVVAREKTPAYDLIGYFNALDGARKLSQQERNKLQDLIRKHDEGFVQRVLSLKTQRYMNTHHSGAKIEQSVCSILNIKYVSRPRGNLQN